MSGGCSKILVVGTTADYVQILDQRFPGRVLFITDPRERAQWPGPSPAQSHEILCDLSDHDAVLMALRAHLDRHPVRLSGIVSYDCESLTLASFLAEQLVLPFSGREAITRCRSKYLSKMIWQRHGVACPRVEWVRTDREVRECFRQMRGAAVLKPLSGSGGELVFFAETETEALEAFGVIQGRLKAHGNHRMYGPRDLGLDREDPRKIVVMEQYVDGEEYSCDFILVQGRVEILRLSKKIVSGDAVFGTILGYELPAGLPGTWTMEGVAACLKRAAQALGLGSMIAMADFKFEGGKMVFLEMTPRLGGDCLIPLIHASAGVDMLAVSLDFAEGRPIAMPDHNQWVRVVGMRLFAERPGILLTAESAAVEQDPRVIECRIQRRPGDAIRLPPEDYDSWILGYVLFRPDAGRPLKEQCLELSQKFRVKIRDSALAFKKCSQGRV